MQSHYYSDKQKTDTELCVHESEWVAYGDHPGDQGRLKCSPSVNKWTVSAAVRGDILLHIGCLQRLHSATCYTSKTPPPMESVGLETDPRFPGDECSLGRRPRGMRLSTWVDSGAENLDSQAAATFLSRGPWAVKLAQQDAIRPAGESSTNENYWNALVQILDLNLFPSQNGRTVTSQSATGLMEAGFTSPGSDQSPHWCWLITKC